MEASTSSTTKSKEEEPHQGGRPSDLAIKLQTLDKEVCFKALGRVLVKLGSTSPPEEPAKE